MNCPQCKTKESFTDGVCDRCGYCADESHVIEPETAQALGISYEDDVIEVTPPMEEVLNDVGRFLERKERRDNSKLFQAIKFVVIVALLFYLIYFEGIVYKRIPPAYTFIGAAVILVIAYLVPYLYMLCKVIQLRYRYLKGKKETEEK